MRCDAIWTDDIIRLGEVLAAVYRDRLVSESLYDLACGPRAEGETGGPGRNETDRHFAMRFGNSAGRSVYICIDPLKALGELAEVVTQSFLDGELLLIDVPCGCGAGSLGLLSAIYERRKALDIPCTPLRVKILAGDISPRAREHFRALLASLSLVLASQAIVTTLEDVQWDANDIISTSELIDAAVGLACNSDRVFLLVSNFSGALQNKGLQETFEHFLSQFIGRLSIVPNFICWIEPDSRMARRLLPKMKDWFQRMFTRLFDHQSEAVKNTFYKARDPITDAVYKTGVTVLRAEHGGMKW